MSLGPLLSPRSIAVVGASDNPKRIGGVPVDLLRRAGFERLYPINPKNETVTIHRRSVESTTFERGDILEADDLLPGFRIALADIFK